MNDDLLKRVIGQCSRLPGLGPRSARRLVLHLLKRRDDTLRPLLNNLTALDHAIQTCTLCGMMDTQQPCGICQDPSRDASQLCVVADVADVWAFERAHTYRGRYHVLGGLLSAIEGVFPESLNIDRIVARAQAPGIREVILALNATIEGQTTLHFMADRLHHLPVKLSVLAHGLPVGGELDYMDDGTLTTAFTRRQSLQAA